MNTRCALALAVAAVVGIAGQVDAQEPVTAMPVRKKAARVAPRETDSGPVIAQPVRKNSSPRSSSSAPSPARVEPRESKPPAKPSFTASNAADSDGKEAEPEFAIPDPVEEDDAPEEPLPVLISTRPAASEPLPESKKGLFSRILPSRAGSSATVFNTDYRTRSAGTVIPTSIRGRGLDGKNIPIGAEDEFRGSLPADFCPTDLECLPADLTYSTGQPIFLRREAARSMERMCRDAAAQGLTLKVFSGYRDYNHQARLYAEAVRKHGKNQNSVARPGRSEHFLGTTADVTNGNKRDLLSRSFGTSPEGRWLERNAARYGWKMTVRAGDGARSHADEPWHIRYLGNGTGGTPERSAKPSLVRRLGGLIGLGKR